MPQKNNIIAIPAFSDNYIWAIINPNNNHIALVDPGHAGVCIEYIEKNKLILSAILITHHHNDHIGGINKLKKYATQQAFPLVIYGPKYQPLANAENLPIPKKYKPHTDIVVSEQTDDTMSSTLHLDAFNLSLRIMNLTGHTLEHVAYFNEELIFCGDTLFSGGCGRIFEGSAQQMLTALTKIAELPDTINVYCAHEYTQSNLQFAQAVEPNNVLLLDYIETVKQLRLNKKNTIPTTIAREKAINPFLRSNHHDVINAAKGFKPTLAQQASISQLEVFTAIREWKNVF